MQSSSSIIETRPLGLAHGRTVAPSQRHACTHACVSTRACPQGALKKANTLPAGATMVVMLPDTGERYLSTPLFDNVPSDMTAEEKALLTGIPATVAFPQPLPKPDDATRALVKTFISSANVRRARVPIPLIPSPQSFACPTKLTHLSAALKS